MFHGIESRLKKELCNLAGPVWADDIKVVAPLERKLSAWFGGSIMSSLSTFQDMWITRAEYDEFGPSIVHKK